MAQEFGFESRPLRVKRYVGDSYRTGPGLERDASVIYPSFV